jgi:hypothetical protein
MPGYARAGSNEESPDASERRGLSHACGSADWQDDEAMRTSSMFHPAPK